jgi:hypothetical protein
MEIEQIINEIKSDIECKICFEKFIKLTNKQFDKFYKDNKELLPETFEDDNCCRCYEDRFECLICQNIICQKCYWNFKNHKFKPAEEDDDYEEKIALLYVLFVEQKIIKYFMEIKFHTNY